MHFDSDGLLEKQLLIEVLKVTISDSIIITKIGNLSTYYLKCMGIAFN